MHNILPRRYPLMIPVIVVLLSIQAILGFLFSLFQLAELLAPGRPIIVSGAAIFTGPAAGVALVVALASPYVAWGVWRSRPWAYHRVLLLEILSLGIGLFELTEQDVNTGVALARMAMAALILLCLYAIPTLRTAPHT